MAFLSSLFRGSLLKPQRGIFLKSIMFLKRNNLKYVILYLLNYLILYLILSILIFMMF